MDADIQQAPVAVSGAAARAQVEDIRRLSDDIVEIALAVPEDCWRPVEAGAHLRLDFGAGLVRCYSLCNIGDVPGRYVVAVKREADSRGGSAAAHALRIGDALAVAGPFNQFAPDWTEHRLVLVAGGIGITPLYAMAQAAAARGHDFVLHYFLREPRQAAYLDALSAGAYAPHLRVHAGLGPEEVQAAVAALLTEVTRDDGLYVCGPRPLIELVRAQAADVLPAARIHWESFGGNGDAAAAADADAPFEISLLSGEGPFTVPPGQSALAVLLAAGIDVPFSCREGECGMCVVEVIEGQPDHRDRFLSEDMRSRGKHIALCVSRARGPRIVVDF